MSIYHSDKCKTSEVQEFKKKVLDFLDSQNIKPYKIKALRSYNGEIRLYKNTPIFRFRLRAGRRLCAFKNPDGSYEGDKEAIEILKTRKGDQLWETTNDPIPTTNYTQVFRTDNWEDEKQAILDFFKQEKANGKTKTV